MQHKDMQICELLNDSDVEECESVDMCITR